MVIIKLAYRNLVGAGLRTWLNVGILSFIYVLIIWHQGLFNGMLEQATRNTIMDEVGGGQYWVDGYDPFDPFTLDDSHGPVPDVLAAMVTDRKAAPILIRQGTIYPEGRVQSVLIKGIDAEQDVLNIDTRPLADEEIDLPILIGPLMARKNGLDVGDTLTLRWRDAHGVFDATDGEIVGIMDTQVPTIDSGQIWVPLSRLGRMMALENEATLIVVDPAVAVPADPDGWEFKDHGFLLKDIRDVVKTKRIGGSVIYIILLFMALLAVFDSQVLAIFRRRKEIGTLMALGMIRARVVALFTLEGAMHGILGVALAAVYGIPILMVSAGIGIPLPGRADDYGFAISSRLFPVYSTWLLAGTVAIVMLTVTVVSYLPSRRISKMNPTEALKGKRS